VIRPSPVFLGLLALWAGGGLLAWYDIGHPSLAVLLFVVAGWIVSLSLHEFSHALFAYRSGDHSIEGRGYLTLNPLKYTHPLLSIVLPVVFLLLGGIGLPGGAVWVNHHAIRGRLRNSLVSLVGPAANIAFFVVLTVVLGFRSPGHDTFWAALGLLAFLQLSAAILNLMPVPGLDGGNALRPWLRGDTAKLFDTIAPFGLIILFGALFIPEINVIFWDVVDGLAGLFGVPSGLVNRGLHLLQFWR
jgi:Zn-dependent protease